MMNKNNSKILLQSLVFISFFSIVNISCGESNWNKFNQTMAVCGTKINDMTVAGFEKIKEINPVHAIFTSAGIVSAAASAKCCDLLARKTTDNEPVIIGTAVIGAVIGASFVRGMYNVRADNAILKSIEIRYGLTPEYSWSQLPGNYTTSMICMGSNDQAQVLLPYMEFIQSKIMKMDDNAIFDFTLFANKIPHTSINGFYCVAKNYFNDFDCQTVGDLRQLIDESLVVVEKDFQQLKKMTSLDKKIKLPISLEKFNNMQTLLSQLGGNFIDYSFVGVFGYSSLHNCQQVQDFIVDVVKVHAFLTNLHDLLATCSEGSDTLVKNDEGNLNFALQHINYVQNVQIR